MVRQAAEVRAWAEEEAWRHEGEQHAWEEEECLMVERDLHEEGGPSREWAPQRWLFLLSSDSAGSPEEEEGMPGPSHDKGKGRVPVSEEVQGVEKFGLSCWVLNLWGVGFE